MVEEVGASITTYHIFHPKYSCVPRATSRSEIAFVRGCKQTTGMCCRVCKHFAKKILDIHSEIDNGTSLADNDDGEFQCDDYIEFSVNIPSFEAFEPLSENDVYNLIMNSKKKSSYLDPVPTDLLMKCLDVLLPVITKIINISLDTGCFPNDWKEAIILPILKKAGLESSFDNLRPISNLAYISKLIERASLQSDT